MSITKDQDLRNHPRFLGLVVTGDKDTLEGVLGCGRLALVCK